MATSYLTKENIYKKYTASKRYTDQLTTPFPEFARIARNRPQAGKDPDYPEVTDGTTASVIRKAARRVVQQLPVGKAENDADDWLSVVADFVLNYRILPYANEEYDFIEKCWAVIEAGETFGACATYTPFVKKTDGFSPDMTLIYWGDVYIQPGKKSAKSSEYLFVRSWWQKEDVQAIIDRERKMQKEDKTYKSSWDLKELEAIKEGGSDKDQQAKTPNEEERGVDTSGIEMITGFQNGIEAEFITFTGKGEHVVRTEKNTDPRGKMPVDWFFADTDGVTPLGRGIVELVGGMQNLLDSNMQMYQWNRALMLAPPIVQYGNAKNVRFAPHAVMKLTDPNAKIDTLKVDTSAIANYPSLYGMLKSQLLNLVSSPDTSISAEVGNPGFSKTDAGVKQQQANISVDDNYLRKKFEAWFENWCETAINIYFAKRSGIEELQLEDEYADRLRDLAEKGKFDLANLSDDNKITIDYDTATPALRFRVEANSSKKNDDSQQLQALTGLIGAIDQSPILGQIIAQRYPEKLLAAWNSLVSVSSVEDPEDLRIDVKQFIAEQQQAKEQAAAQQAAQAQAQQSQQPQMTEEDMQIVQELRSLGVSDQVIAQAIDMLNQGASPQEVLNQIGVTVGG